jgi:hypothetical protein
MIRSIVMDEQAPVLSAGPGEVAKGGRGMKETSEFPGDLLVRIRLCLGHYDRQIATLNAQLAPAQEEVERRLAAKKEAEEEVQREKDKPYLGGRDLPAQTDLELLGVGSKFTEAELKKKYHERARDAHPDRGGPSWMMAALAQAKERLERSASRDGGEDQVFSWDRLRKAEGRLNACRRELEEARDRCFRGRAEIDKLKKRRKDLEGAVRTINRALKNHTKEVRRDVRTADGQEAARPPQPQDRGEPVTGKVEER